jgi:23S rRNA (pseudouridine1915-N3)-methyltransferase
LHIHVIAVGTRMPAWINDGYREYADRLRSTALRLREVEAARRTEGADVARVLADEGKRVLAAVPKNARVIALDRLGRAVSTQQIAVAMRGWRQEGRDVAFLIGGPEGLADECLAAAAERWSLSALTLPHPLVRVVLAEQLYRAWSILEGLPYHR